MRRSEACFGLNFSKNSLFLRWRPVSLDCIRHHPVFRNQNFKDSKQEGRFCGHFSRFFLKALLSLQADCVSGALSVRLSPAAKIPFQTRFGGIGLCAWVTCMGGKTSCVS